MKSPFLPFTSSSAFLLRTFVRRFLTRKSGVSRLELEPGRICETWYNLPAGRLALKIHTTGLEAVRENGCLRMVRAEYRLIWGDGMEVSCRLEVRVLSEA